MIVIVMVSGWTAALVFLALWIRSPSRPRGPDAMRKERANALRQGALKLLKDSLRHARMGYPERSSEDWNASVRAFESADKIDPPAPEGAEPGRLSLVKGGEQR